MPPKNAINLNKRNNNQVYKAILIRSEIIRTGVRSFGSSLLSNKSCALVLVFFIVFVFVFVFGFNEIVQANRNATYKNTSPKEIKRKLLIN